MPQLSFPKNAFQMYEALSKDARNIILEYKCGAELLDMLTEYDARPDRGMELCPFDDPDFYPLYRVVLDTRTVKELFHQHIYHALDCRLTMVASVFNECILLEEPDRDYYTPWTTGNEKLDTRVALQVFPVYLRLLSVEIQDHACCVLHGPPCKLDWLVFENKKIGGWSFFKGMEAVTGPAREVYKKLVKNLEL